MRNEILSQVLANLKDSPTKFNLQLDEATDAANLNQLFTFVHYVKGYEIKEKFLFWKSLATSAKVTDVKKDFR